MANMKTPIFDLNKSGTGNPTVSLEDPVTRRNVWSDILQNPVLSQNYMDLTRRRVCAAFKEQVKARLSADSSASADSDEKVPPLDASTDLDYSGDSSGNRPRLSIVDPNTGEDKWEEILQTKFEQVSLDFQIECDEEERKRSSIIDPQTGKDIWDEIQQNSSFHRNIKELEDKRTRARFREQVLLSLSFDGNTSFDQSPLFHRRVLQPLPVIVKKPHEKSLEPGTERSLTRERISIVDPNTGENLVYNLGIQESKTNDESQHYWPDDSYQNGQYIDENYYTHQSGCEVESFAYSRSEDNFNIHNEYGDPSDIQDMKHQIQMTSDFARDFKNEVHDNPPEENVRDTLDEINESPVKKDSLLSSLHPEILKKDSKDIPTSHMQVEHSEAEKSGDLLKTKEIKIENERKLADVEEVAFSYKHAFIVYWRGMDRITSLIKTKLRSENGGEMLFRGDITVDGLESKLDAERLNHFSIIEFCGDPLWFGLHQLFLTPSTICVFIVDLTENIDMKKDFCMKGIQSSDVRCTYKDYLLMWFQYIQDNSKSQRKIMIYGGHRDESSDERRSTFFDEVSQLVKEKELDKISLISFHEAEGACVLQELNVTSCIVDQTFEKTIQLKWISWYYHIISRYGRTHKMLTIDKLWTLNKEIAEEKRLKSEEEMKHVLKCFSDAGNILFREQIIEIAVLDSQWLVDVILKIISNSNCTNGELKSSMISNVLSENCEIESEFLSYIEAVGLASKFPSSDVWYFPSLNTRVFDIRDFAKFQSSSILCFKFNYHANFIFNMLVSMCISINKWKILRDGSMYCLYRSEAVFLVENHNIVLRTCENYIKVQILWLEKIPVDHTLTSKAKNQICVLFDLMKTRTNENMLQYQTGFSCKTELEINNDDISFISLEEINENSLVQCPRCPVRLSHTIDVKSVLKFWMPVKQSNSSCKNNRESLTKLDGTCFKKDSLITYDVLTSDLKSLVSRSVGMIRLGEHAKGTGFRVGENLIITNLHVVKPDLIDPTHVQPNINPLRLENFNIVFELKVPTKTFLPENYFDFMPKIHFMDEDLDVVILELKPHEFAKVDFPPSIKHFGAIDFSREIHLIGHPGGIHMKEDSHVYPMPRNMETKNFILELEAWSRIFSPNHENYYSPLHDEQKILLHTTFDRGSSGSPGIQCHVNNSGAMVVLMLSGGVPSCFYDGTFTNIPHDKLVEYGVSMTDIHTKLLNENKKLCDAVFNL
ncbi:uncharacterized protein LOC111121151 isoform X8 [Crassostrea virginica]